jgi:hypothetical protein
MANNTPHPRSASKMLCVQMSFEDLTIPSLERRKQILQTKADNLYRSSEFDGKELVLIGIEAITCSMYRFTFTTADIAKQEGIRGLPFPERIL